MGTATLEAPAVHAPVVRRRRKDGGLHAWLFALPALAVYVIFLVYPALTSVWFSFTDWDGLSPTYNVVGLENYIQHAEGPGGHPGDDQQHHLDRSHHLLSSCHRPGLAMLLNGKVRGKPVLRLIFYAPAVLPLVAIASIWGWLYNPEYGAINAFLRMIGLGSLAQPWLGQDSTALAAVMVPGIWLRVGFPMLLYLAALQGINKTCTRPRRLTERLSPNSSGTLRCPACRPTTSSSRCP